MINDPKHDPLQTGHRFLLRAADGEDHDFRLACSAIDIDFPSGGPDTQGNVRGTFVVWKPITAAGLTNALDWPANLMFELVHRADSGITLGGWTLRDAKYMGRRFRIDASTEVILEGLELRGNISQQLDIEAMITSHKERVELREERRQKQSEEA